MKILIILLLGIPLLTMPAWIAYCKKQNNKRYLLHWISSLLPVVTYVLLMAVNPNLASHALIQILVTLPAVMGVAAFFGGLVYFLKSIFSNVITANKRNNKLENTNTYDNKYLRDNYLYGQDFWRNDEFYGRDFWKDSYFWGR